MKKKVSYLISILIILTLLLTACSKPKVEDGNAGLSEKVETKKDVIAIFEGTTFQNETIDMSIFKENHVTMINIWATFCPPCLFEMPDLGEINREYKQSEKSFAIVGLCVDVVDEDGNIDDETLKTAKEITEATNADYTNVVPSEPMLTDWLSEVSAVPTTIFVDSEGTILETVVGAKSKDDWIAVIEKVMEDK